MPLYHINITLNNRREVIVVDHVLEEYGVSEQEFVSVWLGSNKAVQGNGNTFEEAIADLFNSIEFKWHCAAVNAKIKHMLGSELWYQNRGPL